MNAFAIRRATDADIARVAPLFDAYRSFYGQPPDIARADAFLRERLARGESALLLAERDGEALGFTQLYPLFSSVRTARLWLLNDLFVADLILSGETNWELPGGSIRWAAAMRVCSAWNWCGLAM